VRACVSPGVFERAPTRSINYRAFCDPSGGSSDSMTLCIGHNEISRQTVVVDALREVRPPFSPEQVVGEFTTVLRSYRVTKIVGDRFAGIWPVEQFRKFGGVIYEQSAKPKSDLYTGLLPLLNSVRIDLLDHPRLISQLCNLERRTARGGRDSIDHAPGAHDDVANAVAGLAAIITSKPTFNWAAMAGGNDDADPDAARAWREARFRDLIYAYSGGQCRG
jgi:hypothetical protein